MNAFKKFIYLNKIDIKIAFDLNKLNEFDSNVINIIRKLTSPALDDLLNSRGVDFALLVLHHRLTP